ncbi:transposase, partial [mine drainage metagenome]
DAVRPAQIFVAALGYSNAIHAQGFADQTATSWLQGQHQAFVAFGGVPRIGVCDYVARHIIRLMCPSQLCALRA